MTAAQIPWRGRVKVHPAADLFPSMSVDEKRLLGEDIQKRGLQSSIVLVQPKGDGEPMLLDGRNRLDAMEAVGLPVIDEKHQLLVPHEIIDETSVDAVDFVVSANILRRHLTGEQKRALIEKLLKAQPERSDRQIAETTKASPTTVGAVRAKLEQAGDVSRLDTHTDTKGRKQPAAKPRTTDRRSPAAAEASLTKASPLRVALDRRDKRDQAIYTISGLLGREPFETLSDLVRLLHGEQSRIAALSLQKRLSLARGYLQALGVTLDDLRSTD